MSRTGDRRKTIAMDMAAQLLRIPVGVRWGPTAVLIRVRLMAAARIAVRTRVTVAGVRQLTRVDSVGRDLAADLAVPGLAATLVVVGPTAVVDSEAAATLRRADSGEAGAISAEVVVTSEEVEEDTPVVAATAGIDKFQTCNSVF